MKRTFIPALFLLAAVALLSGCALQIARSETDPPTGAGEPVTETGDPGQNETLLPIEVLDVRVEIGVGSPIPVNTRVAGTWPALCAQLAHIDQEYHDLQFDITLLADPGDPDCPPDNLGLPFALNFPINVVELADGTYTVTVNGLSTTFNVPVTPTVPTDAETGAPIDPPQGPIAEPPQAGDGELCSEVPRPALALFLPGQQYLITDPFSGAECYTTLDGDAHGLFQAVGEAVYYAVLEEDRFVVKRVAQDGSVSLLPFTSVPRDQAQAYHNFVVSPDGRRIAWSAARPGPDPASGLTSTLWVSGMAGDDVVTPLPEFQSGDGLNRALMPVRFSQDNSTLFYTIQPIGIGGIWNSFVGRYDNLYALRLTTEAPPTLVFDCAEYDLFLCIGDFYEVQGQVGTLAYVGDSSAAEKSVVLLNGVGDVLNEISLAVEYLGYPTFGPGGELVFYGADLSDTSVAPDMGTLYRVAPATAPTEVLASDPGLLLPQGWLDATHVVIGYNHGGDNWGTALVDLGGSLQVLQSEPNASFVDVLDR